MALLDRILELPAELITEVVHSAVHHGTIPCIELQDMKTKLYRPFEGSALLLNIAETKFYTTNVFSAFVGYDPISPATTWPGRSGLAPPKAGEEDEYGEEVINVLKLISVFYPNLRTLTIDLYHRFSPCACPALMDPQRLYYAKMEDAYRVRCLLRNYLIALQAYTSPSLQVKRVQFHEPPMGRFEPRGDAVELTINGRKIDDLVEEIVKLGTATLTL